MQPITYFGWKIDALKVSFVVLAAFPFGPAFALNKCVGPDGKVSYQDSACPANSRTNQLPLNTNTQDESGWSYERSKDSMTGTSYCIAYSSKQYLQISGRKDLLPIRLRLISSSDLNKPQLVFEASTPDHENTPFHHALEGTGVKTDGGSLIEFAPPFRQFSVRIPDEKVPQLLGAITKGSRIKIRVRFWPYDRTYDTEFSSVGLQTVAPRVISCASTK